MNGLESKAELLIMSAVMIVLSLAGIAAGFSRGLFGGIDGLLILGISLMMVLIFSVLILVLAVQEGWIGRRNKKENSSNTAAVAK
jgi:uncharacterized membrane protein